MIAGIGIALPRFEAVLEHRLRVDVKRVDRSPSDLCEIVGDPGLSVEFGDGADVAVGPNHHATTVAQAVTLGDHAIRIRKDGLLYAATNPPQRWLQTVAKTWATPVPELGTALLRLMLGAWADDEIGPVLRAVLQTAAHEPTTREKLRRVIETSLMGVSQLGVDERDRTVRSGLVSPSSWVWR